MYFSDKDIKEDILDSWEFLKDGNDDFINQNLTQWANQAVPVYTNDIIKDWTEMPTEFDDAWQEFGHYSWLSEKHKKARTIVELMTIDLTLYYEAAYRRVYEQIVKTEQQLAEAGNN